MSTTKTEEAHTPEDIAKLSDAQIHQLLTTALSRIFQHIDLTFDEMYQVMLIIMQGRCSDAMMGAILTGLRMKGESIDEITASASAMRALAANISQKTATIWSTSLVLAVMVPTYLTCRLHRHSLSRRLAHKLPSMVIVVSQPDLVAQICLSKQASVLR